MLHPINIPIPTPARKVKVYRMPETRENLVSGILSQSICHDPGMIGSALCSRVAASTWSRFGGSGMRTVSILKAAFRLPSLLFRQPRGRNILKKPRIAVHLPDADQVFILEGIARIIEDDEIDSNTWDILDTLFQKKYQVDKGSP